MTAHGASRRKLGTGFGLEAEMAEPVARWMRRRGLSVKKEFAVPWGVCDLVGARLDFANVKRRLLYGQIQPVGSLLRLMILSRIPETASGRSKSLLRLRKDFSPQLSPDQLSAEVEILLRRKFLVSTRTGFFQRRNGWAPLHRSIVAVELKLERIPEAVGQAASNRAFATESYVALPGWLAMQVSRGRRAEEFGRNGVGLLAVWRHGCRELIKPASTEALCNEIVQSHVVERFWRTRDS